MSNMTSKLKCNISFICLLRHTKPGEAGAQPKPKSYWQAFIFTRLLASRNRKATKPSTSEASEKSCVCACSARIKSKSWEALVQSQARKVPPGLGGHSYVACTKLVMLNCACRSHRFWGRKGIAFRNIYVIDIDRYWSRGSRLFNTNKVWVWVLPYPCLFWLYKWQDFWNSE